MADGRYDRNLIVIGAGSAGLVSAYIAAAVKSSVTLIEKNRMGGDCLNTGCVPSKALLKSARVAALVKRADEFGIKVGEPQVDFAAVMQRVHGVIAMIEPHDSIERYESLGVECLVGEAELVDAHTVKVNGTTLTTKNIIIASGGLPVVPPLPGLEKGDYVTSENLWQLRDQPQQMIVLGGGPIGCELSQAFARLGSKVTQVEMAPRILLREDEEVSSLMQAQLEHDGVNCMPNTRAVRLEKTGEQKQLVCEQGGQEIKFPFDTLLVAVGRKAVTSIPGLDKLGLELNQDGTLKVDEYMQTSQQGIFACGDVAGPYQFTHVAAHQAWFASINALFGRFWKFKVDYSVIPWATFTEPEVARVGLNEQEAKQKGIAYEVSRYELDELDRAITEGETRGFVKVLTVPGKDRILGATIVAEQAGELITEYINAMKHGLGLNKILGTIHIYPTLSEANKFTAGVWKRAHAPQWLLGLVEKFHRWQLRN
ncbi:MAG: mercuric reductase [Gammaproteobacteria bacterium]